MSSWFPIVWCHLQLAMRLVRFAESVCLRLPKTSNDASRSEAFNPLVCDTMRPVKEVRRTTILWIGRFKVYWGGCTLLYVWIWYRQFCFKSILDHEYNLWKGRSSFLPALSGIHFNSRPSSALDKLYRNTSGVVQNFFTTQLGVFFTTTISASYSLGLM